MSLCDRCTPVAEQTALHGLQLCLNISNQVFSFLQPQSMTDLCLHEIISWSELLLSTLFLTDQHPWLGRVFTLNVLPGIKCCCKIYKMTLWTVLKCFHCSLTFVQQVDSLHSRLSVLCNFHINMKNMKKKNLHGTLFCLLFYSFKFKWMLQLLLLLKPNYNKHWIKHQKHWQAFLMFKKPTVNWDVAHKTISNKSMKQQYFNCYYLFYFLKAAWRLNWGW